MTGEFTAKTALPALKKGLSNPNKAFIYHCYNHYMCPVGFEESPVEKSQAYKKDTDITERESWIIFSDQAIK